MADNEKTATAYLDDDDLTSLFSAFDDVRASDDLKASTLSSILAEAENEPETEQATPGAKALEGGASVEKTVSKAKVKLRVFRMVAIAACLALALTGGAAYALPTSHVKLSQGSDSIDLGINFFGMTVSADAAGGGDDPIRTDDLRNKPYEESVAEAFDLLDQRNSGAPIDLSIDAGDPGKRQQMEDRGAQIISERLEGSAGKEPTDAGAAPASDPDGPQGPAPDVAPDTAPDQQPSGYPPDNGQPGNPAEPDPGNPAGAPAPASNENPPTGGPER